MRVCGERGGGRTGKGGGREAKILKSCGTHVTLLGTCVYKGCAASTQPARHPCGDSTPAS